MRITTKKKTQENSKKVKKKPPKKPKKKHQKNTKKANKSQKKATNARCVSVIFVKSGQSEIGNFCVKISVNQDLKSEF
jgi:hypothetical protein